MREVRFFDSVHLRYLHISSLVQHFSFVIVSAESAKLIQTCLGSLVLYTNYSTLHTIYDTLYTAHYTELKERVPINVPLQTLQHAVQDLNHTFRPRTSPSSIHTVRSTVQTRLQILRTNRSYYDTIKNILDQEVADLNEFPHKIDYYANAVTVFNTYAVNARRQRALQIEINLRKLRLEALRSLRLQTMMEAKQRQIDADKQVMCCVCAVLS